MKVTEEEFYKQCLKLLNKFNVDYTKDVIELTDGGNSCIMNPKSDFYELFGGYSINAVADYVAKKMGKKTKWISDDYEDNEDEED